LPAGNRYAMIDAGIERVTPCDSAIAIIRQEHRSLALLVHSLRQFMLDVGAHKADADYHLVAMMLYYIDTFPDRCHHPKEDEHLFKRLRLRTADANEVLDRLQEEHAVFARMMAGMVQSFVHWQAGAPNGLRPFLQAVNAYADALRNHMELEENQVLAVARAALSADDWRAIDDAFRANDDPLFGTHAREEFAKLRMRIANQLPARLRNRLTR
jgi:hemerythrin-like domain-containing protein